MATRCSEDLDLGEAQGPEPQHLSCARATQNPRATLLAF